MQEKERMQWKAHTQAKDAIKQQKARYGKVKMKSLKSKNDKECNKKVHKEDKQYQSAKARKETDAIWSFMQCK